MPELTLGLAQPCWINSVYLRPGSNWVSVSIYNQMLTNSLFISLTTNNLLLVGPIESTPTTPNGKPSLVSVNYSANIIIDASQLNVTSATIRTRLTGNANLTISNPTDAQALEFEITQDGVGSRALILSSVFNFGSDANASAFQLSTAPNVTDYFRCKYNQSKNKWDSLALIRGY